MSGPTAEILDRLLAPLARSLGPDAARTIITLRADADAQRRMDELAERCNAGTLGPEERAEYEAYVAAGTLVAILQAKARAALGGDVAA